MKLLNPYLLDTGNIPNDDHNIYYNYQLHNVRLHFAKSSGNIGTLHQLAFSWLRANSIHIKEDRYVNGSTDRIVTSTDNYELYYDRNT